MMHLFLERAYSYLPELCVWMDAVFLCCFLLCVVEPWVECVDAMLNVAPAARALRGRRSLAVDKNKPREAPVRTTNANAAGGGDHHQQLPPPDPVRRLLLLHLASLWFSITLKTSLCPCCLFRYQMWSTPTHQLHQVLLLTTPLRRAPPDTLGSKQELQGPGRAPKQGPGYRMHRRLRRLGRSRQLNRARAKSRRRRRTRPSSS